MQRQSYDSLTNDWRSMNPEQLCAMINDTQRMQEKTEEFAESVIRLVPQDIHRELLSAMLEDVSNEYIALAVKAVNYLARYFYWY